jgi:hypothetical protein
MNLIITHCPRELLSRPLFGAIINANIPIDKYLQIINYHYFSLWLKHYIIKQFYWQINTLFVVKIFTDGEAHQKIKISRENFTDKIYLFVFSMVITDRMAVGDCGMGDKYFRAFCKLPTEYIHRWLWHEW